MMIQDETDNQHCMERLEALFFEALAQPPNQRDAFVEQACRGDHAFMSSLQEMLRADEDASGPIDTAPWSVRHIEERLAREDAADPLAHPGARIGPYVLLGFVASGGMGTVWRARRADGNPDRIVAVKLIRAGMDQQATLRRFRLEEQILARLEHPHIARLYDGGITEQGRPYLVMEYVEGLPITDFARRRDLSIELRLKLLQQVCEAVQYAHGSLVLHRDIKPGNILITREGAPKLLDFGIARVLDDPEVVGGTMTATGLRVLTPQYASPEQVRGERLSVATDIYSLGVVLYELMVDRLPYQTKSGTRHELERAVLEQEPARPSSAIRARTDWPRSRRVAWARRTRGEVDSICLTALQKAPAHRYRSAFELGEDIRRHLEGIPLLAKPPSALVRFTRSVRRRRATIVATLLGAAVGIALAAAYVVRTFLVPGWQEEHIRRARLTIVGGRENSEIYNVLFYNPNDWSPHRRAEQGLAQEEARAAATEYDAAMRLGSVDQAVAMEAGMVRLLIALSEPSSNIDADTCRLQREAPVTLQYVHAIDRHKRSARPNDAELRRAAPEDLRSLGLFSLFVGDLQTTVASWSRLPMTEPDPLVECLLGYIHLAMDEPELAYPRLLSAFRVYPESGTIALYLADAAVRCGDLAQASHCLDRAERFGSRDANFGLDRVRMLLLFAAGKEQDAVALLCHGFCGRNAVAELQFARYFERTHGLEQAIRAISGRINPPGPGLQLERATFEYSVNLMEAWWVQLDPAVRDALAHGSQAGGPMTAEEFRMLLQRFRMAREALRACLEHGSDGIQTLHARSRWPRLARPLDPSLHDKARAELLSLAGTVPSIPWKYSCAEQCLQDSNTDPGVLPQATTQPSADKSLPTPRSR